MEKLQLQSRLLHSRIVSLEQEKAFLKLKLNMLESNYNPSQLTLINKQLYLTYMQQVLTTKQNQLIQLQQQIDHRQLELIQIQRNQKLFSPLEKSTNVDILLKKIEQIKLIVKGNQNNMSMVFDKVQWNRLFNKIEPEIVQECKAYQEQTQAMIKAEYQNLIQIKKKLLQSMDKFQELHAYENYLNQLQAILEAKQDQILKKQDQLYSLQDNRQQYQDIMIDSQSQGGLMSFGNQPRAYSQKDANQKKRVKIFESVKKSQRKKQLPQYQYNSGASINSQPAQQKNKHINICQESSYIMQQSQTISFNKKARGEKSESKQLQIIPQKVKMQVKDVQVQSNIETLPQSIIRLQKERKIIKFTNLWLKYSLNCKKNATNNFKKTFALYLFRLNTLFDTQIENQIKQKKFDWPIKFQETARSKQLFPYVIFIKLYFQSQLSLKRKKFAQLTFDLQQKILHRKTIQNLLKSILKNKARKQRLFFVFYFKKLYEKTKMKALGQYCSNFIGNKSQAVQATTNYEPISKVNYDSRLISDNSSRIMNQVKQLNIGIQQEQYQKANGDRNKMNKVTLINPKNSMSTSCLLNKSLQKATTSNLARSITIKQNLAPSTSSLDIKKLKEYIKTQQQTQRTLAIQCIKTQSICYFSLTLTKLYKKKLIYGFWRLKQQNDRQRIQDLQQRITGYQFKWQLFMTKCKLALMNNSNKIGHLEETLGFMLGK